MNSCSWYVVMPGTVSLVQSHEVDYLQNLRISNFDEFSISSVNVLIINQYVNTLYDPYQNGNKKRLL